MQNQVLFLLQELPKLVKDTPKSKKPRSSSKLFCRPDVSNPLAIVFGPVARTLNSRWEKTGEKTERKFAKMIQANPPKAFMTIMIEENNTRLFEWIQHGPSTVSFDQRSR